MSQMEYNKGILHLVDKSVDKLAEELVSDSDLPYWCETKLEYLRENSEEFGLVFIKDLCYRVTFENEREDLYQLARAEVQPNGDIHFETYHYNGGAHWTEVVEGAL